MSFELNFLCADMFPYEDSKTVPICRSVCSYPEKRNHPSFVNSSPTVVIDTSMERSPRVLQHRNSKKNFQKRLKFNFDFVSKCWNHPSFANNSPALVIYTSMERSSLVLQHEKKKLFTKKNEIEFWSVFWVVLKCWNHPSFVNISLTVVIDASMERSSRVPQHGNPKNWFSF